MDDTVLRLECLRLASGFVAQYGGDAIITASSFYAFATGKTDQTPREIISAALDQAGVQ